MEMFMLMLLHHTSEATLQPPGFGPGVGGLSKTSELTTNPHNPPPSSAGSRTRLSTAKRQD